MLWRIASLASRASGGIGLRAWILKCGLYQQGLFQDWGSQASDMLLCIGAETLREDEGLGASRFGLC